MLLEWFPVRRHRWFDVTCCPTNLARMVATVHHHVAEVAPDGDLLVHLPVAVRVTGSGWDVEVASDYPDGGDVALTVRAAPAGRRVMVRVPGWAGGSGHVPVADGGRLYLPVEDQWWETDPRVEGAGGSVFLRRGPVVHCAEGVDHPGVDLRDLVVDPTRPPSSAFSARSGGAGPPLHRPAARQHAARGRSVRVVTVPYHAWANRGPTTMLLHFSRA
jgi:DUF1680 family protein